MTIMTHVSAIESAFDLSLARQDTFGAVVRDGGMNFGLFTDHAASSNDFLGNFSAIQGQSASEIKTS
ncbi:hypothetical protein P775_12620 [Puniceibacterium antarcticum]|uniref:Uncharacterized protein n=1 Tax=Puniceibacterium antarcticum TaxID=1206336 RepID=A0A2G8RE46_9RHOB|nr:hypothetical protein [Puniceibacterium antarcticum]PIL19835.1 hypothetical protein P775_12620 [Puniceibacterium antarcticum]